MATGKALNGKPYAGNPHVRFDEGEVASAATSRRGSLLYNTTTTKSTCGKLTTLVVAGTLAFGAFAATVSVSAVSSGVDIVSAGSDAMSATTVALETRYCTTDVSNFIDMITEKIKGFLLIVM